MHITRHIMFRLLKANNKEKILKAAKDRKNKYVQGNKNKLHHSHRKFESSKMIDDILK